MATGTGGAMATGTAPKPLPMRGTAAKRSRVYCACGAAKIGPTGPSSTMLPCRMTMTRVAISATTPMSWVIRISAVPVSRCRSRSRSSTSRCTVTSSAVVGSSQISTSGRSASAMAIITRWRIPPESSCGYWFNRRSGCEMRTDCSAASARARASLRASVWCAVMASISCAPTVITGFRLVIGS